MRLEMQLVRTDGGPISRPEWVVAAETAGLRVSRADEEWVYYHWAGHKVRGEHPLFSWYDGAVDVIVRDRPTLALALALAGWLRAVVTADGREFAHVDDLFPPPPPGPPWPPAVLENVSWSFPADAPAERAEFDAAVWARQYAAGNDRVWDPDAVVVLTARVRVGCQWWDGDDERDTVVELASENGRWFTAGELLFQTHRAFAAKLVGRHHRFLEGLWVRRADEDVPHYHLRLGS